MDVGRITRQEASMSDDATVSSQPTQRLELSERPSIDNDNRKPGIGREPGKGFDPFTCFPGCGCAQQARTSTDRIDRIRKLVEEGICDPDLFAADFVNRAPWDVATQRYTNDATAAFQGSRVFTDMRVSVEEAFADGDTVVVRWRLRGKWSGPLPFAPSIPPTGRQVEFTGTYFYRFAGNKVVETDGEFDVKAASKALLGGLNITCGSDACVDVVQALSRHLSSGGNERA
jgi:predicted ester cyclase